MDLVEGVDFLDYVRPGGTLDEIRLRSSLKQLVRGILALHEERILHRDLKPSNVLVDESGRVSILDFGLAAELQHAADQTASMQSRHFAGTPRYAAPEQAFGERSPATDWYALGIMLFEALVGEAPFRGTASELLIKKQNEEAPALSGRSDLPRDLTGLVDQLLRKLPRRRPGAAAICETLDIFDHSITHGAEDSSLIHTESQSNELLVGREAQLAELRSAYENRLTAREPGVVFISGRSGEGKTSLADAFLTSLRRDTAALVLSGRCYDRESVPYKAIDPLIDAMVSFLRSQANDSLDDWLPSDIHLLAHLFPILKRVDSIAARATGSLSHLDERQVRYRGFYALKDLLSNIGRTRPIVLFIDDLQWGDGDSAEVLYDILSPPGPPQVMLMGSFRSDEAEASSFLQEWSRLNSVRSATFEAIDVQVEPLSAEECLTLLANRVGVETEQLKQQAAGLFNDTQGNPYFLEQLIEGFNPETRQFTPVPLHEIIDRKLTRLPEESAELLSVIAVAGQAISLNEASLVAGSKTPLYSTITHMRSERLVRLIGSVDQKLVDTYHDKIRETVLGRMSDTQQRRRHLQLAEAIEARERLVADELFQNLSNSSTPGEFNGEISPRVFDLAHHFSQAGDQRAFVYQLLAAEQSLKAYAKEDALDLYQQAERLLPGDVSATLRYRISLAMGRVFLWNQLVDAATESCQQAVDIAENDFDRARAYAGLGHAHRQVANFDEAIKNYDAALEQLMVRRPQSTIGKLATFFATAVKVLFIPEYRYSSKNWVHNKHTFLKHEILYGMYRGVLTEKDFLAFMGVMTGAALAALQTGEPRHLAIGHAIGANLFSGLGMKRFGRLCLRRAGKLESQLRDPALRGVFVFATADSAFYLGSPREAAPLFDEAIPLLYRTGDVYDTAIVHHMNRHARAYVASASLELAAAKALFQLASEIDNTQTVCWGSYDMASASARRGDLSKACMYIQKSNEALNAEQYVMTEAIRASTDAFVKIQCSDYTRARELAKFAWELATRNLMLLDPTLLCLPLLIESTANANWNQPLTSADRKYLKGILRRSALIYPTIPNHQPHLRRVWGRANWALGKRRKAIRSFEKAIRLSKQKGMDYQLAKSLLDLAAVKSDGREDNRREAIRLLKKMESVIPRAESWLLGDQFDPAVVAPAPEEENADASKRRGQGDR